MADGAQERRDAHALGAYLLQVTPTEIHRAEPFEDEFCAYLIHSRMVE